MALDPLAHQVHVDRGGTFTDVVRLTADGQVSFAKVPSDRAVIGELARGARLTFGTTVATNALLEGRGARTLLLVTRGFEELHLLRDMTRPALFDPDRDWPPSLASAVVGVGPDLDSSIFERFEEQAGAALADFEAVAIALLGAPDLAAREAAVAAELARVAPHLFIVQSHHLCPDLGYLARIETALVDAAITPHLRRHLVRDAIPPEARAMRSDGSLVPAHELRAPDAILSGPAGGVLAVLDTARRAGFRHAVGLDMGGTSTDVCLASVDEGPAVREGDLEVAGVRLRRRMLEVETIAAGGGSILGHDGLQLTVGPRSAGADPGPQCYGRGGPPTLTDAALLAGLITPERFPIPLDPTRVRLPGPPELARSVEHAGSFLRLAREAMAQAVTRLAMARGVALAEHALVAYGGAGGQHAAPVAELLGIDTVLVHPAASVFCAWGQALAREAELRRRPLWRPLPEALAVLPEHAAALTAELAADPRVTLIELELELAHHGSDHPLTVPYHPEATEAELVAAFDRQHATRFGFTRALPLEVRVLVARGLGLAPTPPPPAGSAWEDEGLLGAGLAGPRVLHGPSTSVFVPEGWGARLDAGLLRLDRLAHDRDRAASPDDDSPATTPLEIALWQRRFQAIAEEAGTVLQRLAASVSIKERLDFSCALFDAEGRLVANAPHIPVHLGAMGDTVRDVALAFPAHTTSDLDAWLTNDPAAGGSHLPDLTVVTAVHHGDQRFFVASRGHHVDVGGLTPGSIPSRSRTLSDEGLRLRRAPLVAAGALTDLRALVAGSRQPGVVAADLEAQLAANAHLARRLRELGPPSLLAARMRALHAHARALTERFIAALPFTSANASDDLDGLPLHLSLRRELGPSPRLVFDFEGTGGPHLGNLNAPPAVVRAAVLYALRLAIGEVASELEHDALPLNDGTLEPVLIRLPPSSVLSPPPEAAVVGGNVETSQRLVDLALAALGLRAASAGSMSNLLVSGERDGASWAFYETLGAGYGASPRGPGRSARQTHMTNTRATDPEVLAARLPLAVRRFGIRHGSGGAGLHRGGDGLVRELEVLTPAKASLLAAWRPGGAPGLEGGGAGAPGEAWIVRAGAAAEPWDGEPTTLAPGDRVRVLTPGGGGWGAPTISSNIELLDSQGVPS